MVAKRKVAAVVADPILSSAPPPKKKSPLYNQPQNFYAPQSISAMTKEELSNWRKEQRRKRNRESAAASRTKTKARIDELEGEVEKWKALCDEMSGKMAGMERHLAQLMRQCHESQQRQKQQQQHQPVAMNRVVSQPNSPPRVTSPAPPAAVAMETNVPFYPPLASAPIAPLVSTSSAVAPQGVPLIALSSATTNPDPQPYFSSPSIPQDLIQKSRCMTEPSALEKKQMRVSSSSNIGNIVNPNQGVAEVLEEETTFKKKMQHIIPISRQA